MNKNLIKILVLIFSIIGLFFSISLNKEKIYYYSDLYTDFNSFSEITESREETNQLLMHNLKFNNYALVSDENNNFYYSLIKNDNNAYNPIVKWSGKNVDIRFDVNLLDYNLISSSEKIDMIVYSEKYYHIYSLYCSTLPIISIETSEDVGIKGLDIAMKFYMFDNREGVEIRELLSKGLIHSRGGSTINLPKQGFKIELADNNFNTRNDLSLLDLREGNSDYILFAAYNDAEKVRNVFSSNLWYESCAKNNSFGINNGVYYKYTELILNGEYWGIYALGYSYDEVQLKINVKDANENIYKKIDWDYEGNYSFDNLNNPMSGYTIETKNSNWEPLINYYYKLFNYKSIDELYKIADIDNAIDTMLFFGLIQGVDSPYDRGIKNLCITTKQDQDKTIVLYSPWDLDITWGNNFGDYVNDIDEYYFNYNDNLEFMKLNPAFILLDNNDDKITGLIKTRYKYLRQHEWSDEYITLMIDNLEKDIYDSGAFLRDTIQWSEAAHNNKEEKLSRFKEYVIKRLYSYDQYIETITSIY